MHTILRYPAHGVRRHVRRVWASRGGGFYGFVATLTFLYLEATTLLGDVKALPRFQIGLGGVVDLLVQNFVAGLLNVLWASLWPVKWIGRFGVGLASAGLLAGSYVAFLLVRPTVTRLLREPGETGIAPAVEH